MIKPLKIACIKEIKLVDFFLNFRLVMDRFEKFKSSSLQISEINPFPQ